MTSEPLNLASELDVQSHNGRVSKVMAIYLAHIHGDTPAAGYRRDRACDTGGDTKASSEVIRRPGSNYSENSIRAGNGVDDTTNRAIASKCNHQTRALPLPHFYGIPNGTAVKIEEYRAVNSRILQTADTYRRSRAAPECVFANMTALRFMNFRPYLSIINQAACFRPDGPTSGSVSRRITDRLTRAPMAIPMINAVRVPRETGSAAMTTAITLVRSTTAPVRARH